MILTGMAGKGSGKLGSQVYSAVNGRQLVRNYQPNVSNPNTELQVNVRARLKLLSQLSAVFAPVIAFRRKGGTSPRNAFFKKNWELSSGNDGQVMVTLDNLQLTDSAIGLPGILAERSNDKIEVSLLADAGNKVNRIVFIIFKKTGTSQLQLLYTKVVPADAENPTFKTDFPDVLSDLVIYAYGITFVNARAEAEYEDMQVQTGIDIARLVMTRKLSFTSYRFTRTRGCQLYAGEEASRTAGPNEVRVFVTPSGSGNVSGYGVYGRDEYVTIQAEADEGSEFIGWLLNGTTDYLSYSPTLYFKATNLVDVVAIFQNSESTTGGLNGEVQSNPLPWDAQVKIDGSVVNISSGLVRRYEGGDIIDIYNIPEGKEIVLVPRGSSLGDADNIALTYSIDHYSLAETGFDSCSIYYEGMVWFYIITDPWVNPYPDTSIKVDADDVEIIDGEIVLDYNPDFIYISGLTEEQVITAYFNDTDIPFIWNYGKWRNENTGLDLPLQINVNGEPWFVAKFC